MREVALLRALQTIAAGSVLLPEEEIRACLDAACAHLGLSTVVLSHQRSHGALETVELRGVGRDDLPLDQTWAALESSPAGVVVTGWPTGVAVPVTIGDHRFGMLSVWGAPPVHGLGEVDLEIARLVATHVATSLDMKYRLRRVVAALDDMADSPGDEVFERLAKRAATLQQVTYAVVTECSTPGAAEVRPRAIWSGGESRPPVPYALAGTPCAEVLQGKVVHHERQVANRFPNDPRLQALGAESYLGVPMLGPAGIVVGHLAIIHTEPLQAESGRVKLLRDLARRAATCIARARAEESQRTSEQQLSLAVSTAHVAVWDADLVSGEVHLNEHAKRIAGHEDGPDRIDIALWPTLVDDEDIDHLRPMLRAPSGGDEAAFEHRVRHPDGTLRWLLTRIRVAARGPGGEATRLVAVGIDVTERKRIEEQVRESQRLESLGVLAGGIAHDFNNLLMSILGNATLAMRSLPPDTPTHERMQSIETAARRAAELTDQMLTYAGQGPTTIERVELPTIVGEMSRLLETVVSKSATLRLVRETAAAVDGDPAQLRQVAMNLITNASDAIGDDCGTIVVRTGTMQVDEEFLAGALAADGLVPGDLAFLSVRDTGHGMDEATRRRVFDPFFTTRFTGRGLGMAAVSGIVRSHGGAIRIDSQVGQGTTVTVVLPRSTRAAVAPSAVVPACPALDAGGTVLVIDDDAMVQNLMRHALGSAGFEVLTASDGPDGLALFDARADDIRLVLLDVTMPQMSGIDVLAALRARAPKTPVLLMSGYAADTLLGPTLAPTDQPFLHKPFGVDTLLEQVATALATDAQRSR